MLAASSTRSRLLVSQAISVCCWIESAFWSSSLASSQATPFRIRGRAFIAALPVLKASRKFWWQCMVARFRTSAVVNGAVLWPSQDSTIWTKFFRTTVGNTSSHVNVGRFVAILALHCAPHSRMVIPMKTRRRSIRRPYRGVHRLDVGVVDRLRCKNRTIPLSIFPSHGRWWDGSKIPT